jgi:outer membrane receptor protein involved in Fe transport
MKNWINWAQIPDTTTWSVFNIDKADISGVETFFQAGIANKTSSLTGKIMYSYIEAKDKNTGKYIANVPQNRISVNLTARMNSTTVLFQLSDIAERFSTISNKTIIPGYSISNLILSQNFKLHTTVFSVDLGVYNLTDKNYMVMNDYPMPKRNFRAGLRILF